MWFPLRRNPHDVVAAGLQVLYSEHVPQGQEWRIERLAYEGDTATSSGETRARVYIDGHGYNHYLHEQDGPTADALYVITEPFTLAAGERAALEWDEAQADTRLRMYLTGHFRFVDKDD
jgi:hypothetical protein